MVSSVLSGGYRALMTRREAATLLGISENASPPEVASAFRRVILRAHPDRGGSPEETRRVLLARQLMLASTPGPSRPAVPIVELPWRDLLLGSLALVGDRWLLLEGGLRGRVSRYGLDFEICEIPDHHVVEGLDVCACYRTQGGQPVSVTVLDRRLVLPSVGEYAWPQFGLRSGTRRGCYRVWFRD